MYNQLIRLIFSSLLLLMLSVFIITGSTLVSASGATKQASSDLLGKGITQLQDKEYLQAIRLFEQSIVANPANAQAYSYLGRSYQEVGNSDRAYKYYDIALTIDPEERRALSWSGEVDAVDREMDLAAEKLAKLERICGSTCAEYQFLQSAINNTKTEN